MLQRLESCELEGSGCRLGAFGFPYSSEIKSRGVLKAGLLDQVFALQWAQKKIAKFGVNPDRVTITDESAGGGSAMLHTIAQGGSLGTAPFKEYMFFNPLAKGMFPGPELNHAFSSSRRLLTS